MNFEIYCDESHGDLLASKNPKARFLVIGGLWIEANERQRLKDDIHKLRSSHRIRGEFKWNKVSAPDLRFYEELLELFISHGNRLRFRCIAVDPSKVNLEKYHNGDAELGFFKFYYQMLHRWINENNDYKVFCDYKKNSEKKMHALKLFLRRANLLSNIELVQSVHSNESVLIQFADVLTGMAAAKLNGPFEYSSPKGRLIMHFESQLGVRIEHHNSPNTKFNVFVINPGGGW